MLTISEKRTIGKFYSCIHFHIFFHYSPPSRMNMTTPVHNRELMMIIPLMTAYLQNYGMDHFESEYEARMITNEEEEKIVESKKYLIPYWLENTALQDMKRLLLSSHTKQEDIVSFLSGIIPYLPDDSFKKNYLAVLRELAK